MTFIKNFLEGNSAKSADLFNLSSISANTHLVQTD